MTRLRTIILAVVLAVVAALTVTAAASAAACPTGFTTAPKAVAAMDPNPLLGVRVGSQACFDRVVFDVAGPASGYSAAYVTVVHADGSGLPLYVPGGGKLQVVLHHPAGHLPYLVNQKAANVAGFPVLRSVTYGGSFEGYTTYGVGVDRVRPFRVFTLAGPGAHSRVVLDVARG